MFITRIGGGYRDDGKVGYLRGGAEVAVGPGTNGCSALGFGGDFRVDYKPMARMQIKSGLTVICIPLFEIGIDIYPGGYLSGKGVLLDYRLGPAFLKGHIEGSDRAAQSTRRRRPALAGGGRRWRAASGSR